MWRLVDRSVVSPPRRACCTVNVSGCQSVAPRAVRPLVQYSTVAVDWFCAAAAAAVAASKCVCSKVSLEPHPPTPIILCGATSACCLGCWHDACGIDASRCAGFFCVVAGGKGEEGPPDFAWRYPRLLGTELALDEVDISGAPWILPFSAFARAVPRLKFFLLIFVLAVGRRPLRDACFVFYRVFFLFRD